MIDIVVSRRAEENLREIWRYIAHDNEAAADRLLLRIDERIQGLQAFPEKGVMRDDVRPRARMLVEGNYLILYEYFPAEKLIEIVAVVDGRRDLSKLF